MEQRGVRSDQEVEQADHAMDRQTHSDEQFEEVPHAATHPGGTTPSSRRFILTEPIGILSDPAVR